MTKYYVKAPIDGSSLPVGAEVKVVTENSFAYEVDMGTHYEYISKDCIKVVELPENLDFGYALMFLKQGKKVARKGWNSKGQFVYYVPADRYVAKTDAAKSVMDEDGKVSYRAYLALKTAQGDIATWVPSISDCLADDWEVVE